MIKLTCTKYLVRARRVCEMYSWQFSQVTSASEISDGIGHACTTRSLCSPSENDEYESTKQNKTTMRKITMRRQLPASRRPLRGGRAATKGPPHLRSQQRYLKVISSSSWSKVPFERPSGEILLIFIEFTCWQADSLAQLTSHVGPPRGAKK